MLTLIGPGLNEKDLTLKGVEITKAIKRIVQRLSLDKYVTTDYVKPFRPIKIFPTSKLMKEINSSIYLRNIFENRYNIQEVIKNVA
jgi:diphthamide biosynthesis methyltransferase